MDNTPTITAEELDAYLSGECDPAEQERIARALEGDVALRGRVDVLRAQLAAPVVPPDPDLAWRDIARRLGPVSGAEAHHAVAGDRVARPVSTFNRARSRGVSRSAIGGVIAAIALIGAGVRVVRNHTGARTSQSSESQYRTAAGERLSIRLADGSHVVLAPGSQLLVAAGFPRVTRIVTLTGEAFFDAEQDPARPLVVRAGSVATRVLGTRFDVRHYDDESDVRVTVVSGRVAMERGTSSVTLAAGHTARIGADSVTRVSDAHPEATAWTQGRLVFDDVPASVMLASVGRWFGYDFKLADSSLATRHVSAVFRGDAPVETMTAIKVVLGVTLTFEGKTVIVRPQSTASRRSPRRYDVFTTPMEAGK